MGGWFWCDYKGTEWDVESGSVRVCVCVGALYNRQGLFLHISLMVLKPGCYW